MVVITASVHQHTLTIVSESQTAAGSRDVDEIRFTFDETWNGWGKEAVFWCGDPVLGPYSVPVRADGTCTIPWKITETGGVFSFAVKGVNGDAVFTTQAVEVEVPPGIPGAAVNVPDEPEPTAYDQILSNMGTLSQAHDQIFKSFGMVYSKTYTRASADTSSYFIFSFPVELEAGTYFLQCECNIPPVSLAFFTDSTVNVASQVLAVAYGDINGKTYTVNITAEQAAQIKYIAMYANTENAVTAAIRIYHSGIFGTCKQNEYADLAQIGEHTIGFQTSVLDYCFSGQSCDVTIGCNVADNSGFYFGGGKITYFRATANGKQMPDGAYKFTLQNDQALVVETAGSTTPKQICVKNKTDIVTSDIILASFYVNDGMQKLRGIIPDTISASKVTELDQETLKGVIYNETYNPSGNTQGYLTGGDPEIHDPTSSQELTTDYISVNRGDLVSLALKFTQSRASWVAYIVYNNAKTAIGTRQVATETTDFQIVNVPISNDGYIRFSFRSYAEAGVSIKKVNFSEYLDNGTFAFESVEFTSRMGLIDSGDKGDTLESIKKAKRNGYNHIRLNLCFTADGIGVLSHDETVQVNSQTHTIAQTNYSVLSSALDKFEDAVILCKRLGMQLDAELKFGLSDPNMESVWKTVAGYGMCNSVTWTTSSDRMINKLIEFQENVSIGLIGALNKGLINKAYSFKNGKNTVRVDTFNNTHPTSPNYGDDYSPEVLQYAAEKGIPIKLGSAYSLDEVLEWLPKVQMIECGYMRCPAKDVIDLYLEN